MAENKTKPTKVGVESYLGAIVDDARRTDCEALARLMTKVTKHEPVMWGPSIVGFGSYHYRYESGREGDMCLVGFSSRKSDITVYLNVHAPERDALLARLGKHRMGGSCLHIRKLGDVDPGVLKELILDAVAEVQRRHGAG